MDNKLYRIEVIAHNNLPTIDTIGMLMTNEGIAYVKLHPVKLTAKPRRDNSHGHWIDGLDGSCMCSECNKVVRYEIGYYCPNCGALMDGDKHE